MFTSHLPFSRIVPALVALSAMAHLLPAQTVTTLVGVTPCRIMDTRYSNGAFGTPYLVGNATRDIPVPSSSCGIPTTAVAYSLNVTIIPHQPFSYLSIWPTGQSQPVVSTLNAYSGAVAANAAIVPAGTNGSITVFVTGDTELIVDINGYFVSQQLPIVPAIPTVVTQSSSGTTQNTALGSGTSSTSGAQNTAVGANALAVNNDGVFDTALGAGALASLSSGNNNTAVGANAMSNSSYGSNNSVLGSHALESNTSGHDNTVLGYFALSSNTLGQSNTALGSRALAGVTSGIGNIGIGASAGSNLTTESNNVNIASAGVAGDSGIMRIGTAGTQFAVYMPPILGNSFGGGTALYINSSGKLGMNLSSRRYKEDIRDIGDSSSDIFKLRPVQFRYKKPDDDGTKPLQYGLIAEEVDAVYPQLVVHSKTGDIEGVQYQQLPALLLNEVKKQQTTIVQQQEQIQQLLLRLEALEAQVGAQATQDRLKEQ